MGILILCEKCTEVLNERLKSLKEKAEKGQTRTVHVAAECDGCKKSLGPEDEIFCKDCFSRKGYNSPIVRN